VTRGPVAAARRPIFHRLFSKQVSYSLFPTNFSCSSVVVPPNCFDVAIAWLTARRSLATGSLPDSGESPIGTNFLYAHAFLPMSSELRPSFGASQ